MYCTVARLRPAGLSRKAVSVAGKGQEDGKDVGKWSAQRLKAGPSAEVQCRLCPSQLKPADPTCVPAIFVRQHRRARPDWSQTFTSEARWVDMRWSLWMLYAMSRGRATRYCMLIAKRHKVQGRC